MQQADFQQLARERLADAEGLLTLSRWAAAYYLAGYSVECGLKACVLRHLATDLGVIFRMRRFSERCWTHDLKELIELAGLEQELGAARLDPQFNLNWQTVVGWTEGARYNHYDETTARAYVSAVSDPTSGVLTWIGRFW